ncbi:hypothetical protein OG992_18600 [Micromonospora sp. NBC_00362]|uniref:hypothetical protein n=1 Tax=Micromonospora sp. NBC_00362 TaxID=2975975 RepID=UPI002250D260|nr:hypothetical protein [Micromonospora sp. NBC_00362]MCX5119199.1 hypothetical protein [Micromonospora sp. NBC_00362]
MDPLFWILVITWMVQRGVTDGMYAFRGKPNPRYELKKAKALAAGQAAPEQHRYGGRDWAGDLLSDAMAANTKWRRSRAKAKAQPVDDMIGILREPKAQPKSERVFDPNYSRTCPDCKDEVTLDGRPCPRCVSEQQRRNALWDEQELAARRASRSEDSAPARTFGSPEEREEKVSTLQDVALAKLAESGTRTHRDSRGRCPDCGEPNPFDTPCSSHNPAAPREETLVPQGEAPKSFADGWTGMRTNQGEPMCQGCQKAYRRLNPPAGCGCPAASGHTAQIIQFPNPNTVKEIDMSNPEAAGLSTAIAFAEAAASAHHSFATAGAEGYIGALQRGDMDGEPIDTAREAMEASGIAADKWNAHKATLEAQQTVKEAYQAQPGAANKEYLLNG